MSARVMGVMAADRREAVRAESRAVRRCSLPSQGRCIVDVGTDAAGSRVHAELGDRDEGRRDRVAGAERPRRRENWGSPTARRHRFPNRRATQGDAPLVLDSGKPVHPPGSCRTSKRLDESRSGFDAKRVRAPNHSETAVDPASGRGTSIAWSFSRRALNSSCQDRWNGMKVRSDSIQSSSVALSPSRFSGMRKATLRSRPRLSASVRSLTGLGFAIEACESSPRTRKVRSLIARSMSRGTTRRQEAGIGHTKRRSRAPST